MSVGRKLGGSSDLEPILLPKSAAVNLDWLTAVYLGISHSVVVWLPFSFAMAFQALAQSSSFLETDQV